MDGQGLIRILVEATGLPQESLEKELMSLISERGIAPEAVTLDDIREILENYLQDTLLEAKGAAQT